MDRDDDRVRTLRIGFIGAGRLGSALAWSLAERGLRVVAATSTRYASAKRLAAAIDGCIVAGDAQQVVDASDLVFIVTPDAAIERAAASARWRSGVAAVHCSGATEVTALASAARDGAMIGGFHPMQAFTDPAAAVRSLPGCTITIEAGEPLDSLLVAIAERLSCRVNRLPPGMRGRYHAAAGYASQFVNVLFGEASSIWASWGASREDAVRALLPLARGTLASIERAGVAAGMPGPVSRGDVETIAKHVAALESLDPHVVAFYRTLCASTIPLALECGAIDAQTAERIRAILSPPDSCP
jgi:predicted short-subunit dehydrogenase-like oxidoreductase (DUF2520 family)